MIQSHHPKILKYLQKTNNGVIAAFKIKEQPIYGLQFHPEVSHTTFGNNILSNFIKKCNITSFYTMKSFKNSIIQSIKEQVGNDKVVMAVSGGVDSSVTAMLLHEAIGKNLRCVFVNNGLLRKNEVREVKQMFKSLDLSVNVVEMGEIFYKKLQHITNPEEKRKIIGTAFIKIFEQYIELLSIDVKWIGQGTIYPDVIESVPGKGLIKSHHNVGGLPKEMKQSLIEPIRTLFKDEVRELGKELKLPEMFLSRHPFPGPGLGIRIIGEITKERVKILQEADHIFIDEIKKNYLYDEIWQAGAILLPIQSVGVMGDCRTYESSVVLRAVTSVNGMTAKPYHFNMDFLETVSTRIVNNVKGVNRIVYDTTSKPPGTIEWE